MSEFIGVTGLHHVSLVVSDTTIALRFYEGVLGLPVLDRPVMRFPGAWLALEGQSYKAPQASGQQLHLLEVENPDATEGRPDHGGRDRHVALQVGDLQSMRASLDKAGIIYTLSASGREALFCRDPDGNAIELIQA